jgi:hypothetical protein
MSGAEHILGNVSFGPAQTLWEEQPSLRELYDQACAGLVRAECENDELRAEVALLREEQAILKRQFGLVAEGLTVRGVPIEELQEDFLKKWRRDK